MKKTMNPNERRECDALTDMFIDLYYEALDTGHRPSIILAAMSKALMGKAVSCGIYREEIIDYVTHSFDEAHVRFTKVA